MKIIDMLAKAFDTDSIDEIVDNFVVQRLKDSRDMCIKERERIDNIANVRTLQPHEAEDWECLVQDIQSLNRVIEYYGGTND